MQKTKNIKNPLFKQSDSLRPSSLKWTEWVELTQRLNDSWSFPYFVS